MKRRYLLDTNICISLLKNKYGIRETIIRVRPENCFVSEITLAELYYGAAKSNRRQDRMMDVDFIRNHFEILPIYPALSLYGDVKAVLEEKGNRLDDFDLLIGTTAIVNKLVMVSDNVKHLERIPKIVLDNWVVRDSHL
ncbi:MAG: type II toxin-antitoxin system VapC family toxin [Prevotella sp.]|nr:type II toxin-antitoxin system VapC family toxin [Prevotella sp.]